MEDLANERRECEGQIKTSRYYFFMVKQTECLQMWQIKIKCKEMQYIYNWSDVLKNVLTGLWKSYSKEKKNLQDSNNLFLIYKDKII